nr:MAG: hypothetical protein KatS3mg041_1679 [Bacteroidota bacterium]
MPCTACESDRMRFWTSIEGYALRECPECGYAELCEPGDPEQIRHIYNEAYFTEGGVGYPGYLDLGPALRATGRWYASRLLRYTNPGWVLDIGSAAGFILWGFREQGWQAVGLEPNAQMAAYGRQQLGLDIRRGEIERFEPDRLYEATLWVQVLAHVQDLNQALDRALRATRPGGLWLVETWDRASWLARLMGKRWHNYAPPSVRRWFTPKSLIALLRRRGLELLELGRPPKRTIGRHIRASLLYQARRWPYSRIWRALARCIPDRMVLPYPGRDLFYAVFRLLRCWWISTISRYAELEGVCGVLL